MNKTIWIVVCVLVIAGLGAYIFFGHHKELAVSTIDPLNATYSIAGEQVTLMNGKAVTQVVPGSASQLTTMIFGQPATGNLNADGVTDAAIILVQDSGGSGSFYYVAADISGSNGTQGTNAVFLGDRIAPENIEIQNGDVVVNYADRKPGEPMTATPSIGVTKYLAYRGSMLVALPSGGNPQSGF